LPSLSLGAVVTGPSTMSAMGSRLALAAPAMTGILMRQVEGIGVQGKCRIRDHRGHVVGAAGFQRHHDQTLGALLLIGNRGQSLFDCRVLQNTAQTVRAEQPPVRRLGGADGDIRVGVDVEIAEHSHNDIALRMILGFGFADSAGVDEVLERSCDPGSRG
jgi:hypothetical protein